MLGNLTSNTKTLDAIGRTYVTNTVDVIFGVPLGTVKYVEDKVVSHIKKNTLVDVTKILEALQANQPKVTLVVNMYAEISLSLFPSYATNPRLLFQGLSSNLSAAIASSSFTTLLHQKAVSGLSRSASVGVVSGFNVTCINLQVQYADSSSTKANSGTSTSQESISGNVLIGLVAISVIALLLCIGCLYFISKYYYDKAVRRRKALQSLEESNVMDKPVWFDDADYEDNSNFNFDLNDLRLGSSSRDNIEYVMKVPTEER